MKSHITVILCIAFAKLSSGQYQQYENLLTPYLSSPIESGYFYFNQPNNLQAGALYQIYKISVPDLNNDMLLINTHVDSLAGLTHYKYQQLYKTIPVEAAGCIEHYDQNGSLLFINAKIADSINSEAIPGITAKEAIEGLIDKLSVDPKNEFAWENADWEQQARLDYGDSAATWYPTAELVFAIDDLQNMTLVLDGARYTLAYKISVTMISPDFETFNYYVNALNGEIIKIRSTHVNDGPADIYGYGSRSIDTQFKGGFAQHYILKTNDATRVIHTKKNPDINAWWLLDNTTDNDDNWGSTYQTETTTHYHVTRCWDYFKNVFGRTGQNNESREVRVRTQWNDINAQFVPSGGANYNDLNFGRTTEGYDYGLEPSVVAHEFTHGVTYHSSNLQYEYESGALNESFSDIFGTVIYATMLDGGLTDWIYGNFVPNSIVDTRSLEDPNSRGQHIESGSFVAGQPDTYLGEFWYDGTLDNGGVHINSGIGNKWFYVLAHGDNGFNDLDDYYDVDGIGMTKSAKIAYYALTSILMNSSQYSDARQATIQASIILYGECSVEHQSTVDAWYAVGVGIEHTCNFTLDISNVNQEDLMVYPNPASEILNIELPYSTNKAMQIYDVSGKLVREIRNESIIFQTDISMLDSGVYTIHFSFNGNVVNKRFIVQK